MLRAMHQWITDNGHTAHIIVDASADGVEVPRAYVAQGQIVLNVSHTATGGLDLGNEWVSFEARFGGVVHHILVPVGAVRAIYARESGEGMVFAESECEDAPDGASERMEDGAGAGPEGEASGGDAAAGAAREAPQGETVRKRPTLTVVK